MDRSPNLWGVVAGGLIAFAADASVLALMTGVDVNPLCARLVGMAVAALIGWMINRTLTFAEESPPTTAEFISYVSGGLTNSGINFTVFAIIMICWPQTYPIEALVIAAGAALVVSFAGYARLVFREDP